MVVVLSLVVILGVVICEVVVVVSSGSLLVIGEVVVSSSSSPGGSLVIKGGGLSHRIAPLPCPPSKPYTATVSVSSSDSEISHGAIRLIFFLKFRITGYPFLRRAAQQIIFAREL